MGHFGRSKQVNNNKKNVAPRQEGGRGVIVAIHRWLYTCKPVVCQTAGAVNSVSVSVPKANYASTATNDNKAGNS